MNIKTAAYYNIKINYGVNKLRQSKINSLVAPEIKNCGKKILDLGCAGGYLSATWHTGNYLAGADISPRIDQHLKDCFDDIYTFDLESEIWPSELTDKKYDIILAAEVIEHLFAPRDFLLKVKKLLATHGHLILSTPNFLVWNNRVRICRGHYGLKEIFNDYGHIHLFSYNSFKHLLKSIDAKIIDENNIWYPNNFEKFSQILPANLFVYQLIMKIRF